MREAVRVLGGILAASVVGYGLAALLLAASMAVETSGMDMETAIGSAISMMMIYAFIAFPATVLGCGVVFGTTCLVLRALGLLHWIPFPLVGAAVLIVLAIRDSQGPLFASAASIATFVGIIIVGIATGCVFWWLARPARPSRVVRKVAKISTID
jgi:hypothetical protein